MLCGGWPDCPPRATLDGIQVIRVGTRLTWPVLARGAYRRLFRGHPHDVLVEDINKMPLFTPRWGARRVVALVPHLFGGTAFQELAAPLAAVVWLSERPLAREYRGIPFHAISESDKLSLLRRSWALAFASPKEGWGITNLEAAACGTPVVASSSPGIRESVRDGETGFLVPHGDTAAMAVALWRIAGSPVLVRTLGANARTFAESFTWERAALETESHLATAS